MTNYTTTDYGTWNNYNRFETSPMASVLAALSGSDTEWLDRMDAAGAIDSICSDYCSTISDALPDGIVLTGDHFIGPYPYSEAGGEAIERAIEIAGDQLAGIMQRHDVDLTTADQLDMDTLTTIEAGIWNGNRVQLIIRGGRTITAHEHVGHGWIDVTDGHTLGWVVGPGHDINNFRAWRYDFGAVLAQSTAGTFDLEYAVYGTAK